jgi:hypothetical protein
MPIKAIQIMSTKQFVVKVAIKIAGVLLCAVSAVAAAQAQDELAGGFANPHAAADPWT